MSATSNPSTFTVQAHGPLARYDRADGVSVFFDGAEACVSPENVEFHVLTWPRCVWRPFKMQGEGINLSDLQTKRVGGADYTSGFQKYGADMSDTPDDWSRFYRNPDTSRIDCMSNTTCRKNTKTANKEPSITRDLDCSNSVGPLLSTPYEFWFWDTEALEVAGDSPGGLALYSAFGV